MAVCRPVRLVNARSLGSFYSSRADAGLPMVLGMVCASAGSTYSKAGDAMLIDAEGRYQGMLSGGCLEGDLAIRASAVIETGRPAMVVYDLASDDELWGLGVGCDGRIDVILLRLDATNDYQPFAAMQEVFEGREPARLVVGISDDLLGRAELSTVSGKLLLQDAGSDRQRTLASLGGTLEVELTPLPRILILGAGPDVVPVVRIIAELGWRAVVCDHRPAYLENPLLELADARCCAPADKLENTLALDDFDAALVMSHHLASDRAYLRALACADIGYVGLLGPAARRDRLLVELGADAERLVGRLHGPAGLALGGRGAAPIALSLVAGLQEFLAYG